jgi:hypothetical protein
MRHIRPVRLAVTATLTITAIAVVAHPSTRPVGGPDHAAPPGPIDTLVTAADPELPAVSAARVTVAREVQPVMVAQAGDIPITALLAYQRAATVANAVDDSCRLPWTLLAAVGGVESDHGRSGGAALDDDGVSSPAIRGVPLDGHGVARVADTDAGRVDGDRRWDRAVGPMQFLPSTWATVGVDADGDGVRSADDLDDAALGAAVFLCAAPGSLDSVSGMRVALRRYNPSAAYVTEVIALEREYRSGSYGLPGVPSGGDPIVVRADAPLPTASGGARDGDRSGQGQPDASPSGQPGGDGHAPGHDPTTGPSTDPTTGPTDPTTGPTDPTTGPTDPTTGPTDPTTGPTDPTTDPTTGPPGPTTPPPATTSQLSGTLASCGTDAAPAWCLDSTALDLGDADYLAATALADFDADGAVETNTQELAGLVGTAITVTVQSADGGGPPQVLAIGDQTYRSNAG